MLVRSSNYLSNKLGGGTDKTGRGAQDVDDARQAGVVGSAGDFLKAAAFGMTVAGPMGPFRAAAGYGLLKAVGEEDAYDFNNANEQPGWNEAYDRAIKSGLRPNQAAQQAAKDVGFPHDEETGTTATNADGTKTAYSDTRDDPASKGGTGTAPAMGAKPKDLGSDAANAIHGGAGDRQKDPGRSGGKKGSDAANAMHGR